MAEPDRPPRVVVVADDDDLVRAVLRMALESPQLIVRDAADTESLDEALRQGDADLVVLDISIPGPGLAHNIGLIRTASPAPRILILSGDAAVPQAQSGLIDDFARKPIELDDLRERVARLLNDPPVTP
ncbi:response regulator [Microcella sp.]|uniref:response regulator n=1 Tax=Microcella sp. TaxID=1913979 RepID=UPI00391C57D4